MNNEVWSMKLKDQCRYIMFQRFFRRCSPKRETSRPNKYLAKSSGKLILSPSPPRMMLDHFLLHRLNWWEVYVIQEVKSFYLLLLLLFLLFLFAPSTITKAKLYKERVRWIGKLWVEILRAFKIVRLISLESMFRIELYRATI